MLKRFVNQFSVTVEIEALEPLLVRSGTAVVNGPDMAFVRTQRNGRFEPFLPGSSLKGVLRSHAERVARTLCEGGVCDVFEYKGRPTNGCSWRLQRSKTAADYRQLCPSCRLFGSLHWKGRFMVSDAYLLADFIHLEPEVRDGVGIDRVTGGVAGGAKFDLEVLPAGVRFETRIDVVNFELWQIGWLAYVLRDLNDGYLRVGAGTSRGLGRIRGLFENMTVSYTGEPAMLQQWIPGIGALLDENERKAYGLLEQDRLPRPEQVVFSRPRGALRSEYRAHGHKDVLEFLAHLAPSWDTFVAGLNPLSASSHQ